MWCTASGLSTTDSASLHAQNRLLPSEKPWKDTLFSARASLCWRSLRARIGEVPQDMVLFNESIYYNIAYGQLGASREDVYAAARQAAIHHQVSTS